MDGRVDEAAGRGHPVEVEDVTGAAMAAGVPGRDRTAGDAAGDAVVVEDLTVAYDARPALWDVDVRLPDRALTAVVGPNGAGKSTLIKAILGLVTPASGRALIHGRPYREVRRRVAYVPQRGSVDWDFPTSALDVVLMGRYGHLGWLRRPGAADRRRAREALAQLGMEAFADRQIRQLSGGQQQRVFLARALVQEADVYLMDEPFVGVDATTEKAIITLLRELRSAGKCVAVVHHDLTTVREYFDHLVLVNVRIVAVGPVATTFTVENLSRAYGGQIALVSGLAAAGAVPPEPVATAGVTRP